MSPKPAAKAGPERAAGGRTRPRLRAEAAAALEPPAHCPPAAGRPAPGGRSAARCSPGSRLRPLTQLWAAASRDHRRNLPRACSRGPGASPRTPGASSAPTREPPRPPGIVAEIWGAPRRRVWRPQGLPNDGAPARELLEHAPGAAGAGPGGLARAGNGFLGGDHLGGPGPTGTEGRGPPAATGRQSPGARHLSLGTLGLSGRGSGRATETREPGAVGLLLRERQVGDSVPPGTQSAEPGAFLTFSFCYFVCLSLFDSYQTMITLLVLLSQLPIVTFAFPHCTRSPKESRHAREEGKHGSRLEKAPWKAEPGITNLKGESVVFEMTCPHQSKKPYNILEFNLWSAWQCGYVRYNLYKFISVSYFW